MPIKKPTGRAGVSDPARPTQEVDVAVAAKRAIGAKPALTTELYLTVAEAAELLCVCTKTIRNRIKSGDLEAYHHGRRVLVPMAAIENLIRRGRM